MTRGAITAPQPLNRLVECPQCQGEGFIYWQGAPGYYYSAIGVWLPSEGERICPVCDGDGEVTEACCPICAEAVDSCMCTEDDYEIYYTTVERNITEYQQAA